MRRTAEIRQRPRRLQLPRDPYLWLKALLLALIGVQIARILLALATPLGPVGRWLSPLPPALPEAAQTALLTSFNPFSPTDAAAPGPVQTAAGADEFKLFGTRADGGGVPGSAIIAGTDGQQVSLSVGEELTAGVRLVAVGFDGVTLERGGQRLQLLMDPEPGAAAAPAVSGGGTSPTAALTAARLREGVAFAPRQSGGRITGLLVSPLGDDSVMQAAGLRSGDVIIAVNGRRITSVANASALQAQVAAGARLSLTVERGAATVPVALILAGS